MNQQDPIAQFKNWYARQPPFTRAYLSIGIAMSILISLQVLNSQLIYTDFATTIGLMQIWRPFTAATFMGGISFFFIFKIMLIYLALTKVQSQIFNKDNFADFLWLVVYLFTGITLFSFVLPLYFTTDSFTFSMIYIWCKRRPFQTIRLMFGFNCKSGYFPWVYMGFTVLMGGSLWGYVAALPFAHFYIVAKDIFVPKYHKDYLATPKFFVQFVNKLQRAPGQGNRRQGGFGGRAVRIG